MSYQTILPVDGAGRRDIWLSVRIGAISTDNIWQFGEFDRQDRLMTQDLDLYPVPADLDNLLRILIQALNN